MIYTDTMRAAKQLLSIDQAFGMDVVPLGRANVTPLDETPAAPVPGVDRPNYQRNTASAAEKAEALEQLREQVTVWVSENWPKDGWTNVVFGEGNPDADLMFIGEGPGADEDAQSRPFVGRAGQLLDKQIMAMKLKRDDVYIANIAKTRPPGNRVPTPDEAELWMPWLEKQIEIISPRAIVTLGATSAKYLMNDSRLMITKVRGQWRDYRGIHLMPTFHPAYLLRQYTVENRRRVWDDLKKVLEHLGLPVPK